MRGAAVTNPMCLLPKHRGGRKAFVERTARVTLPPREMGRHACDS